MATLRSAKQTGREASEGRAAPHGRGAEPERSGSRVEAGGSAHGETTREWLVARARQRIESGFYEDPLILDAVIYRIAQSSRQSGPKGRDSSAV
ncbi:MAG TPA: hypothetical protein VFF69_04910 [Phycisphaerales bacterium]|nr:hypothetical protein [Phycisphaerales bacterium]